MDVNGMFDPENSFWSFMNKVCDVCVLSVLWLVCSLPVVTVGAATVSLLSYTLKQADDREGYAVRSFFKEFRRSFLPATALWLVTVAAGGILYANLYAVGKLPFQTALRLPLYSLALCLIILYACFVVWAFALLSAFRIPLAKVCKDALPAAAHYPVRTLLCIAILVLAGAATWMLPALFFVWFALALFFGAMVLRGAVWALRSSV